MRKKFKMNEMMCDKYFMKNLLERKHKKLNSKKQRLLDEILNNRKAYFTPEQLRNAMLWWIDGDSSLSVLECNEIVYYLNQLIDGKPNPDIKAPKFHLVSEGFDPVKDKKNDI